LIAGGGGVGRDDSGVRGGEGVVSAVVLERGMWNVDGGGLLSLFGVVKLTALRVWTKRSTSTTTVFFSLALLAMSTMTDSESRRVRDRNDVLENKNQRGVRDVREMRSGKQMVGDGGE
jgi:hypothetical protein